MSNCHLVFISELEIQGAMNMELPLVGDGELDKKIEEWLQWDKVITHCVCQVAVHYELRSKGVALRVF
jgi:hypothetical protein